MTVRQLYKKFEKVECLIKKHQRLVIALSGGVDSSLLLALAHKTLSDSILAITVSSPFIPAHEIKHARMVARSFGIKHIIIPVSLLNNRKITVNERNRCYFCKKLIFGQMLKIAKKHRSMIIEASNLDDTKDFRPGLQALRELKVLSPFISARITKSEIRILAKRFGLITWNKPSNACLATRIPYGIKITLEILKRIDRAETYLHNLGFSIVRVRDHSPIARIEILPADFSRFIRNRIKIVRYLKRLGFKYPALDLQGYKTGNLN